MCFQGQSASLPAFHSAPWPKEPYSTSGRRATASSRALAAEGRVGLSPFPYPKAGKSPFPSSVPLARLMQQPAGAKGGLADRQRLTVSVRDPEPSRVHRFVCPAAPRSHQRDPQRDRRSWPSASRGSCRGCCSCSRERRSWRLPRGSLRRRLNPGCWQGLPLVGPLLNALLPASGDDVPAQAEGSLALGDFRRLMLFQYPSSRACLGGGQLGRWRSLGV